MSTSCQDSESSYCCHFNYVFILDSFQNLVKLQDGELDAVLHVSDCELKFGVPA